MTTEEHEEHVEWRVETETTEDEFGNDEQDARDWLQRCNEDPDWEPAVLMSRTVTVHRTAWQEVSA